MKRRPGRNDLRGPHLKARSGSLELTPSKPNPTSACQTTPALHPVRVQVLRLSAVPVGFPSGNNNTKHIQFDFQIPSCPSHAGHD